MPHSRKSSKVRLNSKWCWHYLLLYENLELFRQCGIICYLFDFGHVPTVWHYLFFDTTLELFRQGGNICFSIEHWNCHTVGTIPKSNSKTNNATLSDQFQSRIDAPIIYTVGIFPKSHRKTNNTTALLVCLWVYGTVLTMCHYLVSYWTLELFR
jgi:hypothetical protein